MNVPLVYLAVLKCVLMSLETIIVPVTWDIHWKMMN